MVAWNTWSLRRKCIALAIVPVAMRLRVLEYRHQHDVYLIQTMNRVTPRNVAGLDVEQQISTLEQQIEMNLATPLLDEQERQAEIEMLHRALAKGYRLRQGVLDNRECQPAALPLPPNSPPIG